MNRRRFIKTGLIYVPWLVLPHDRVNCSSFLPIPSMDGEAYSWAYSRVPAQSSSVSAKDIVVANQFMVDLKRAGFRSRAYRVGIYLGNDLNAVKAPLIADKGDATDTIVGFTSSDYTVNGLKGDGSTKYLKTGFVPNALTGFNDSLSIATYSQTSGADTTAGQEVGAYVALGQPFIYLSVRNNNNLTDFASWNNFNQAEMSETHGDGFYIGTRTAFTSGNNVFVARYASSGGATPTNSSGNQDSNNTATGQQIYVHVSNQNGNPVSGSTRRLCFYWIGSYFTGSERDGFFLVVQRAQTAKGRAI
jgi:hypothetical protein